MDKIIDYIGSKNTLYPFLSKIFFKSFDKDKKIKFVDGFAGTCVVSKLLNDNTKWDITLFDISHYSEILSTYVSNENISFDLKDKLIQLDNLKNTTSGHIFNEFGMGGKPSTIIDFSIFETQPFQSRMFFTTAVSQKIDAIRNSIFKDLKAKKITEYEKNILMLFVLNYANKNANVTSVFGAYLKYIKHTKEKPFFDPKLFDALNNKINAVSTNQIDFQMGDIITNLFKLDKVDAIYLDPPYNTRRYESNYHILNYISDPKFNPNTDIKVGSKTATTKLLFKNPFANAKQTEVIFNDMILLASTKATKVFVSYNNEGIISHQWMDEFCSKNKLKLKTHQQEYKRFTSGENSGANNGRKHTIQEIVWEISR